MNSKNVLVTLVLIVLLMLLLDAVSGTAYAQDDEFGQRGGTLPSANKKIVMPEPWQMGVGIGSVVVAFIVWKWL